MTCQPDILNVQNFTQPDFRFKKLRQKERELFQNLNRENFVLLLIKSYRNTL